MKTKRAVCFAVAVSLAASSLAFGQGRGSNDRDRDGRADRGDRGNRAEQRDNGVRRHGPPGWSNNRYDRYPDGARRWNKGDRLPIEYRDRQYIVDDWRGHRLSPPPRGYQWVQSGSDYLLVAIATGIILQLLMSR